MAQNRRVPQRRAEMHANWPRRRGNGPTAHAKEERSAAGVAAHSTNDHGVHAGEMGAFTDCATKDESRLESARVMFSPRPRTVGEDGVEGDFSFFERCAMLRNHPHLTLSHEYVGEGPERELTLNSKPRGQSTITMITCPRCVRQISRAGREPPPPSPHRLACPNVSARSNPLEQLCIFLHPRRHVGWALMNAGATSKTFVLNSAAGRHSFTASRLRLCVMR